MTKCLLSPSLMILKVWDLKIIYGKSCGLHIFVGLGLTFDPSFQCSVSPLLLALEVWDAKTDYRKSCTLNLLVCMI